MTATTAYCGPGTPVTSPATRWIATPRFDLAFFAFSPLLGLACVLAARGDSTAVVAILANVFIGFPHYVSTFVFYFWDENHERHARRWLVFFAVPVSIVVTTLLVFYFRIPYIVAVVTYFWNCIHVSRQSCGIISIYRHENGSSTENDKRATNTAVILLNLWFALWNTETYPTFHASLSLPSSDFPRFLWVTVGALAVAASLRLVWKLVIRARAGSAASSPELLLIVVSVAMFHPYLWTDAQLATLGMLVGHFVQYLGIVWLIHRRKFSKPDAAGPQWLRRLSVSTPALLSSIFFIGLSTFVVYRMSQAMSREGVFLALSLSLSFVHFYLDGLFWSFRDPHVRRTLGPYLAAPRTS